MSTFASILRGMSEQAGGPPLLAVADMPAGDQQAVDTVRRGLMLRSSDPDESFWADLRRMAGANRVGLARLLGVSPTAVAQWPQIIDHFLQKARAIDAHANGQKRPTVIGTGFRTPSPLPPVRMTGPAGDTNIGAGTPAPF
jgi:hypothetical protein